MQVNVKSNDYKKLKNNTLAESFVNDYQETWERRSSIRTRPRKYIDFNKKGYFFPEDKQPILLNHEVQNLGQKVKEEILVQSFYKYLNDIINLEINLISSVCNKIVYSDLPVQYPEDIKLNCYTVIIDEYYHVYNAKDMLFQLNQHFPYLQRIAYPCSDAYNAIEVIKNQIEEKYHDIFEIISVCLFETTLVRELVEFFNTEGIHPSIQYYVNDHMNDEAKHYGFFFNLLSYTWKSMPDDYKRNIGNNLASFIKLYLNVNSEKAFNEKLLKSIFEESKEVSLIIEELYRGFDITPDLPIVKNVLSVLKKTGLDQDAYIRESFKQIGWNL